MTWEIRTQHTDPILGKSKVESRKSKVESRKSIPLRKIESRCGSDRNPSSNKVESRESYRKSRKSKVDYRLFDRSKVAIFRVVARVDVYRVDPTLVDMLFGLLLLYHNILLILITPIVFCQEYGRYRVDFTRCCIVHVHLLQDIVPSF